MASKTKFVRITVSEYESLVKIAEDYDYQFNENWSSGWAYGWARGQIREEEQLKLAIKVIDTLNLKGYTSALTAGDKVAGARKFIADLDLSKVTKEGQEALARIRASKR